MHTDRFFVIKFLSNIPSHSEIWILINSLRYQAIDICSFAKNMRKCIWKGWYSLNSWIGHFTNVIFRFQTKDSSDLVISDLSLDFDYIGIHFAHVSQIRENEGQIRIKSTGNDVLHLFPSPFSKLLEWDLRFLSCELLVEIFFVFSQLNNTRDFEDLLEPLSEHKG